MLFGVSKGCWDSLIFWLRVFLKSSSTVTMASFSILLLQLVFFLASLATAQELIASLDYGTFQGAYSQKYNITYFQKIPFAAPPVGENRFRAPQPPLPITNGTYNSTQPFDMCPQRTVRPNSPPPLRTFIPLIYFRLTAQKTAYT